MKQTYRQITQLFVSECVYICLLNDENYTILSGILSLFPSTEVFVFLCSILFHSSYWFFMSCTQQQQTFFFYYYFCISMLCELAPLFLTLSLKRLAISFIKFYYNFFFFFVFDDDYDGFILHDLWIYMCVRTVSVLAGFMNSQYATPLFIKLCSWKHVIQYHARLNCFAWTLLAAQIPLYTLSIVPSCSLCLSATRKWWWNFVIQPSTFIYFSACLCVGIYLLIVITRLWHKYKFSIFNVHVHRHSE